MKTLVTFPHCRCRNIFSVQQCLTNITMNREADLDHARQYYELLYLSPDVSTHRVVESASVGVFSFCICFTINCI